MPLHITIADDQSHNQSTNQSDNYPNNQLHQQPTIINLLSPEVKSKIEANKAEALKRRALKQSNNQSPSINQSTTNQSVNRSIHSSINQSISQSVFCTTVDQSISPPPAKRARLTAQPTDPTINHEQSTSQIFQSSFQSNSSSISRSHSLTITGSSSHVNQSNSQRPYHNNQSTNPTNDRWLHQSINQSTLSLNQTIAQSPGRSIDRGGSQWSCPDCTLINPSSSSCCLVCQCDNPSLNQTNNQTTRSLSVPSPTSFDYSESKSPTHQPVSESSNQSSIRSLNQSNNQSNDQSNNQSSNQSNNQSTNRPKRLSAARSAEIASSIDQTTKFLAMFANRPADPPVYQPARRATSQALNQSNNQTTTRSVTPSINQSNNQSSYRTSTPPITPTSSSRPSVASPHNQPTNQPIPVSPTSSSSYQGINQSIKPLTVVSYNIWFDEVAEEARMAAIADQVRRRVPDVVLFQEVTDDLQELLFFEMARVGFEPVLANNDFTIQKVFRPYGEAMFRRVKSEWKVAGPARIIRFESEMGRALEVLEFQYTPVNPYVKSPIKSSNNQTNNQTNNQSNNQWSCPDCTLLNPLSATRCLVCQCVKPSNNQSNNQSNNPSVQPPPARVLIATSHLESMASNSVTRLQQLKQTWRMLQSTGLPWIFGGDTNLSAADSRSLIIPPGVSDAWIECGSDKEHQWTWDMSLNRNLETTFSAKCRFDRFYFDSTKLKVSSFYTFGKEKIYQSTCRIDTKPKRELYPSDHWGIVARFHFKL